MSWLDPDREPERSRLVQLDGSGVAEGGVIRAAGIGTAGAGEVFVQVVVGVPKAPRNHRSPAIWSSRLAELLSSARFARFHLLALPGERGRRTAGKVHVHLPSSAKAAPSSLCSAPARLP